MKSVSGVAGHVDDFRGGPLDGVGGEAGGKGPRDVGRDADDAGVLPVGVVAFVVVDVEADGEWLGSLNGGGVGDEFEIGASEGGGVADAHREHQ